MKTNTKSHRAKGLTLVELLLSLFIFSTIVAGIFAVIMGLSNIVKTNTRVIGFQSEIRSGTQKIAWYVRQFRAAQLNADDTNIVDFWYLEDVDADEKTGKMYFEDNAIKIQFSSEEPITIMKNINSVEFQVNITTNVINILNLSSSYFDNLKDKEIGFHLNLALQCQGLR